jgi:hypothetical protein
MTFSALPIDLQNIYMFLIEFFIKALMLGMITFFCYNIVNTDYSKMKTPYYVVGVYRAFIKNMSRIVLFFMPMILMFAFYPQFDIGVIQQYILWTYWFVGIAYLIILFINSFAYGIRFVLGQVGFDDDEQRTNQVLNDVEKYTGVFWKANLRKIERFYK